MLVKNIALCKSCISAVGFVLYTAVPGTTPSFRVVPETSDLNLKAKARVIINGSSLAPTAVSLLFITFRCNVLTVLLCCGIQLFFLNLQVYK